MNPYIPNSVSPIKEAIYCSTCTIHPPNTTPCVKSRQKIPSRCKTIHVHGMPKNTTELVIKDIFKRYGNIIHVRMNTAHWTVKFWMQDSVDAALALSGCKVNIGNSQDIDDTGQIFIDCSKNGNEYKDKMVQQEQKVNAASDLRQAELPVPLSGMHHDGEALDTAGKKSDDTNTVQNEDQNPDVMDASGDDDVDLKDKKIIDLEKENLRLKSLMEKRESVMVNIKEQLRDRIAKGKNLFLMRFNEMTRDKDLKLAEAEAMREKHKTMINDLENENEELKKNLASLQQKYNYLVKQGDVASEIWRNCYEDTRTQLTELQIETSRGKQLADSKLFDLKEAKLIGIISTFLLIHPFGVSFDRISDYVRRLDHGVVKAKLHYLLKRCQSVFKFDLTKGWTLNTFSSDVQPMYTSQSFEDQSATETPPQTSNFLEKTDVEFSSPSSIETTDENFSKWSERRRLQFIMEHFKEGWSTGFERRIQEFRKSDHPWGTKRRKHLRISENEFWKFTIPPITPERLKWLKENVPIPDKYEEEYILEERGLLPNVSDGADKMQFSYSMGIVEPGDMDVASGHPTSGSSKNDLTEMFDKCTFSAYDCERRQGISRNSSIRNSFEALFEENDVKLQFEIYSKAHKYISPLSQISETTDKVDCATTATDDFVKSDQPKDESPRIAAISKPMQESHDLNVVPESLHLNAKDSSTRLPEISNESQSEHTKDPASTGNQERNLNSENSCHFKKDVLSADNKVADLSVLKAPVKTALADVESTTAQTKVESKAIKTLYPDDLMTNSLRPQEENLIEAKTLGCVDKTEDIQKEENDTTPLDPKNVKVDETIRVDPMPSSISEGDKKNEGEPIKTSEVEDGLQISAKSKFSSMEEEHRLARILTRYNKSHYWSPELKKRLQQFVPPYCAKSPFRLSMTSSIGTIIEVCYRPLTSKQMESLAGVDIPQKYPEEYAMEKEAAKDRYNSEGWLFTPEGRTRLSRIKIINDWRLWSPELRKALETLRPASCFTNFKSRLFMPDGTFKRITLPAVTAEELKKINEVVVPEKLLEEYIDEMSGGSDDSFAMEEKNAPSSSSGQKSAKCHQMGSDIPIDHESVMKDIENTIDQVQKFLDESKEISKSVKSGQLFDALKETGNADNIVPANVDPKETNKRKVIDTEGDSKISRRKLDHCTEILVEIKTIKEPTNKEEISIPTNSVKKKIENITETSNGANPSEPTPKKISSKRKSNLDQRKSVENRDRKAPRVETHLAIDNKTKETETSTSTKEEMIVAGSKNPTNNSVSLKHSIDTILREPSAIVAPKKIASDKMTVEEHMTVDKHLTEPSAIVTLKKVAVDKTSERKSGHHDKKQKAVRDKEKLCKPTTKVADGIKIKKKSRKETESMGQKVPGKTTPNKISSKKKSNRLEKRPKENIEPTLKAEKPNSDKDTNVQKKSDQSSECSESHAATQGGSENPFDQKVCENSTQPSTIVVPEKTSSNRISFKKKSDRLEKKPIETKEHTTRKAEKPNSDIDTNEQKKDYQSSECSKSHAATQGGSENLLNHKVGENSTQPSTIVVPEKTNSNKLSFKKKSDRLEKKPIETKEPTTRKAEKPNSDIDTNEQKKGDQSIECSKSHAATQGGSENLLNHKVGENSTQPSTIVVPEKTNSNKLSFKKKSDRLEKKPRETKDPTTLKTEKPNSDMDTNKQKNSDQSSECSKSHAATHGGSENLLNHKVGENTTQPSTIVVPEKTTSNRLSLKKKSDRLEKKPRETKDPTTLKTEKPNSDMDINRQKNSDQSSECSKSHIATQGGSEYPIKQKVDENITQSAAAKINSFKRKSDHHDRNPVKNRGTKIPQVEKPNLNILFESKKEVKCTRINATIVAGSEIPIVKQGGNELTQGESAELLSKVVEKMDTTKKISSKRKSDHRDRKPVKNKGTDITNVEKSNAVEKSTTHEPANTGKNNTQICKDTDKGSKPPEEMHCGESTLGLNQSESKSNKKEENLDRKTDGSTSANPRKTTVKRKSEYHDRVPAYNKEPIYVEKRMTHIREEIIVAPCIIPLERQGDADHQDDPRLNYNNRKSIEAQEHSKNVTQFFTVPVWSNLPADDVEMKTNDSGNRDGTVNESQFSVPRSSRDTSGNLDEPPKKLFKKVDKNGEKTGESKCSSNSFRSKNPMKGKGLNKKGENKSSIKRKSNHLDRKSIKNNVIICEPATKETCTSAKENVVEAGATISIPSQIQDDSHNLVDENILLGQEVERKIMPKDDTKTCEAKMKGTICTPAKENVVETGATIFMTSQIQGESQNLKDKNKALGQEVKRKILSKDDAKFCEATTKETINASASGKIVKTHVRIAIPSQINKPMDQEVKRKLLSKENLELDCKHINYITKTMGKDDTKTCETTITGCTPASENTPEVGATISFPVQIQGDSHNSKDENEPLMGLEVKREILQEDGTKTSETAIQEAICAPASENIFAGSSISAQIQSDSHNPKEKNESSSGRDVDNNVSESDTTSVTIKVEPEDNHGCEMNLNQDIGSGTSVIKDEPVDDVGETTGKITITAEDVLSSIDNANDTEDDSKSTSDSATRSTTDGMHNKADDTVMTKEDLTKRRKSIDERPKERRLSTESSNKHTDTYQINDNKADECPEGASKQTAVLRSGGQSVAKQPEFSKELEMIFKVFGNSNRRSSINQISRNDSESNNGDGETSDDDDRSVDRPSENDPDASQTTPESIPRNTVIDSQGAQNTFESDKAAEEGDVKQEPKEFVEPSAGELSVKQEPPEPHQETVKSSATLTELSENTQLIRNELDNLLGDSSDKESCDTYWSSIDLQRLAGNFVLEYH